MTTHNENLVAFIIVQNLDVIALVVIITQKFGYFARLARMRVFTPNFGCSMVKIKENGEYLHCYPSGNALPGIDVI